jgi:hypothetical protein
VRCDSFEPRYIRAITYIIYDTSDGTYTYVVYGGVVYPRGAHWFRLKLFRKNIPFGRAGEELTVSWAGRLG